MASNKSRVLAQLVSLYSAQAVITIFNLYLLEFLSDGSEGSMETFVLLKRTSSPLTVFLVSGFAITLVRNVLEKKYERENAIIVFLRYSSLIFLLITFLCLLKVLDSRLLPFILNFISLKACDVLFRTYDKYSSYGIAQVFLLVVAYAGFVIFNFVGGLIFLIAVSSVVFVTLLLKFNILKGVTTGIDSFKIKIDALFRSPGEVLIQIVFSLPLWLGSEVLDQEYRNLALMCTFLGMSATFLRPVSLFLMDEVIRKSKFVSNALLFRLIVAILFLFMVVYFLFQIFSTFVLSMGLSIIEPLINEASVPLMLSLFFFTLFTFTRTLVDAQFSVRLVTFSTLLASMSSFLMFTYCDYPAMVYLNFLVPYIVLGLSMLVIFLFSNRRRVGRFT